MRKLLHLQFLNKSSQSCSFCISNPVVQMLDVSIALQSIFYVAENENVYFRELQRIILLIALHFNGL